MYGLGGSTNLSDKFPWGIWIGFDVMCGVGLAAGGFTLVAIVHIFNIEKYKPVLRPAILTAFLGYSLVVVGLLFDLGRPDRLWHPLVMWNPHSVMFEVAWCVTLYTTVLFLEFLPMVFEKFGWHKPLEWIHRISVPLMILGVLLSTLHQSSLGTLFLIVPEKLYPLWYTPILPLLFYFRRSRSGLAMTIFESLAQQPRLRPRAGTAAAGQHGARAGGGAERLPLDPFPGPEPPARLRPAGQNRIETWLFWLEIALMVVPTVLLFQAEVRMQSGRAVRLRGDGGVRLHRQPPERRHHGAGSRQRHALHPEVERGGGHAVDRGRGLRDLPLRRADTSRFSRRTRQEPAPAKLEETEEDPVAVVMNAAEQTSLGSGRQARDLRDREHGGLLRFVRLSSTCAWSAAIPRS